MTATMTETELEHLFSDHYGRLVGAVVLAGSTREQAEDAVQVAMSKAWELTQGGAEIDHPAAWVAAVAMNEARGRLRRSGAERRALDRLVLSLPSRGDDVGHEAQVLDAVAVLGVLRQLTFRQRQVVVLRYYLDLSTADAASALHINEGTVKTLLARARAALEDALEDG